jgi:hypothetical protein
LLIATEKFRKSEASGCPDTAGSLLESGASGELAVAGEIEVMPRDDEELLASAKPVTPDGKVRVEPAKLEARHDAQVKAALANRAVYLHPGWGHDLSRSVRRLAGERAEYIRVTTSRYKELAGQEPGGGH